jgi:hypothetical protein
MLFRFFASVVKLPIPNKPQKAVFLLGGKMSKESVIYFEQSQVHRKNIQVICIAVSILAGLLAFSGYKWLMHGVRQPLDVFIYIMFIVVLLERAHATYIYELDNERIRIVKKGLLGAKTYTIPYQDIMGIYGYKAKLVNPIKFRRTYRLNSALDNRKVWVMAYQAPVKSGKAENRRIYFKAEDEMLRLVSEQIPNRVKVKEEQIVVDMLNMNDTY